MKLYFSPGACSLAPHIVAQELGLKLEAIKVDLVSHTLADGSDYYAINPRGYVPLLELDDGSRHSEAAAMLQYLGDLDRDHQLLPAHGTAERLAVIEWLTLVSTELHKTFSWLWHKETAESTRQTCKDKLALRFKELNEVLKDRDYLTGASFTGASFTVADAYAFTVVNWCNFLGLSLSAYPALQTYLGRVAARPHVQEALRAEGLLK